MRRAALVSTWLAATLMAVVAAWGGVQLVARQVVDPLPASMAEASGTLEPVAPPPETETAEPTPSPTAEPTAPPTVEPTAEPTEEPDGDPGTPATQPPAATPTPAPAPPEPEPTPRETRTYELVGGTVSIAYSPDSIRVIQATPKSGFTRKVEPERRGIKVEFESDAHRSRIDAWWDGGPQRAIREDERD